MPVGGYITRSEISGSWSIDNCGNKGTSSYPILNNRKPLKGEAERQSYCNVARSKITVYFGVF